MQVHSTRRQFLQSGIAGALAATASCSSAAETEIQLKEELTIADMKAGQESSKFTARSLTEMYLAAIDGIDRKGPTLRSVIETNPDAIAIADELDKERKTKGPRGPLHGIPILIKDNIDTADKMMTTAGSLAMIGAKPSSDAYVVKQLRKAGVVLLGKTNLSEWANYRSNRSTSGWSGRGGLTKNPYALDRNPSGSSSGSGVAVAANLCAAAVGTETDGSIISPSTVCGVVGLKPTVGLISRVGIIPISRTQDTAGPMARTVADVAFLLSALTGADREDWVALDHDSKIEPDYTKFLDAEGLKGARIGIARRYFGNHPTVDKLMNEAIEVMRRMGVELVDPLSVDELTRLGQTESTVLSYEFKAGLNAYLERLGNSAPVKSLKELIAFNEQNRDQEMPYFGQETFVRAEGRGPLTDKEYLDALERCRKLSRAEGIDAIMEKHNLDAIVGPSGGPANATDLIHGNRVLGGCSGPAAVAGYPHITVPAGFVFGLPVGISFFGKAWSEPTLIKLAYSFEQATKHRKAPKFMATI